MKLYALLAHVIEDTEILGVYDTNESAEAQKNICESKGWGATLVVMELNLGEYYEIGLVRNHNERI